MDGGTGCYGTALTTPGRPQKKNDLVNSNKISVNVGKCTQRFKNRQNNINKSSVSRNKLGLDHENENFFS